MTSRSVRKLCIILLTITWHSGIANSTEVFEMCGGVTLVALEGDDIGSVVSPLVNEKCTLESLIYKVYESNPDAFFGSIHHLKKYSNLYVPLFYPPPETELRYINEFVKGQFAIWFRYQDQKSRGFTESDALKLFDRGIDISTVTTTKTVQRSPVNIFESSETNLASLNKSAELGAQLLQLFDEVDRMEKVVSTISGKIYKESDSSANSGRIENIKEDPTRETYKLLLAVGIGSIFILGLMFFVLL